MLKTLQVVAVESNYQRIAEHNEALGAPTFSLGLLV